MPLLPDDIDYEFHKVKALLSSRFARDHHEGATRLFLMRHLRPEVAEFHEELFSPFTRNRRISAIITAYAVALLKISEAEISPKMKTIQGYMHLYGIGTEVNQHMAKTCFESAALHNDVLAQFSLAECYEYGYGTDKDQKLSADWHDKAARQGFFQSLNQQDQVMHFTKQKSDRLMHVGVPIAWYQEIAGTYNDPHALCRLGHCYRSGVSTVTNYSEVVRSFTEKDNNFYASEGGKVYDSYPNYRCRILLPKDEAKAFECYHLAAQLSNREAQRYAAGYYATGEHGANKHLLHAIAWQHNEYAPITGERMFHKSGNDILYDLDTIRCTEPQQLDDNQLKMELAADRRKVMEYVLKAVEGDEIAAKEKRKLFATIVEHFQQTHYIEAAQKDVFSKTFHHVMKEAGEKFGLNMASYSDPKKPEIKIFITGKLEESRVFSSLPKQSPPDAPVMWAAAIKQSTGLPPELGNIILEQLGVTKDMHNDINKKVDRLIAYQTKSWVGKLAENFRYYTSIGKA